MAAALIAGGSKIKDAAAQAGIGDRTLRRWLDEDPTFTACVRKFRADMLDATLGKLSDGMGAASDVLRALLEVDDPDVKYKAAAKIVELGLKVRDQAELEERLRKIEEQLAKDGSKNRKD